ncbi:hypothetical protein D3C85_1891430 [compost metagenome]
MEQPIEPRDMRADLRMVDLGVLHQQHGDDGDPYARTDVARQAVESGAVGSKRGGQGGEGNGRQRYE